MVAAGWPGLAGCSMIFSGIVSNGAACRSRLGRSGWPAAMPRRPLPQFSQAAKIGERFGDL